MIPAERTSTICVHKFSKYLMNIGTLRHQKEGLVAHIFDDYDMFNNSAYYIFVIDKDNVNYITC